MNVIKYVKVNHQIFQFGDQKSLLDAQIYIKRNRLINQIIKRVSPPLSLLLSFTCKCLAFADFHPAGLFLLINHQ